MKQKLLALILALVLIPAVLVTAAQAGHADSLMDGTYAVIGGDEALTIRTEVAPGGPGGYCQALYEVALTGEETKAQLDALALKLVKGETKPLWGGSKHCYHGGAYTEQVECTVKAAERKPGTYLYVCYAFGCTGGYNHLTTPYYERISTMAVRVTEESRGMELRYALTDKNGRELASFENGGGADLDLNGGPVYLQLQSLVEHPNERIVGVEASFDQENPAFAFDGKKLELKPLLCGSGSITVTIAPYLGGEARTETVHFRLPCAPQKEATVLLDSTCTEEGLAAYRCHGYGVNCETVIEEVVIPARGHDLFSVSQYIEKPTATLPGLGMGTCRVCGLIGVEAVVDPIFSDVSADGYYSRALDHCYAKGWVSGATETTFAPNSACVRAQVVTFLWRAAGCPEPKRGVNPFVDVKPSDFYYEAVLWAAENGITAGTDATHFSPKGACNRAQVVTFLWRAFGQPTPENQTHPFTDVPGGSFYEAPVLWAVEEGITSGMTATTFGPNANCTRAQIVSFLYRAYAE